MAFSKLKTGNNFYICELPPLRYLFKVLFTVHLDKKYRVWQGRHQPIPTRVIPTLALLVRQTSCSCEINQLVALAVARASAHIVCNIYYSNPLVEKKSCASKISFTVQVRKNSPSQIFPDLLMLPNTLEMMQKTFFRCIRTLISLVWLLPSLCLGIKLNTP